MTKDESDNELYIISVCSPECRDAIWKQGPGAIPLDDMINPVSPPIPRSDPEEILSALEDSMKNRNLTELRIQLVSGKFMITATDKAGESYAGLDESLPEAFAKRLNIRTIAQINRIEGTSKMDLE